MIKVGPGIVYERKRRGFARRLVLTGTKTNTGYLYYITNEGKSGTTYYDNIENYTPIAEYPTWQEAVNSKEFKKKGE